MSRHRGFPSPVSLEFQFPHIVEESIQPLEFKHQLDLIDAWLIDNVKRHRYARWGRHRDGQDIAVWAFSEAETAAAFRQYVERVRRFTARQARAEWVRLSGRR